MSDIAISVENLSKQYRLGEIGTGTISHDLNRWWHRIRGKEDPYAKVGDINDRSVAVKSDFVWALKDIDFNVKKGEILGVIGKNGAGKSTLLKVLSKVTGPSTGKITMNGRVASLLEVGTGFHPELTGRENIYLNGAILGMTKFEVKKKLAEIVDFAGVARYLDTPVKRYSSGMMVRLGFAVAAHLEPEILIVDEVLAVGDAEFQKKAIGKMQDVSKGEGRTVLFVSHNMSSVEQLCNRAILLDKGELIINDSVNIVISKYLSKNMDNKHLITNQKLNNQVTLNNFSINKNEYFSDDALIYKINFEFKQTIKISGLALLVYNKRNVRVAVIDLRDEKLFNSSFKNKTIDIEGEIESLNLIEGDYWLGLFINSTLLKGNFIELLTFSIKSKKTNILPFPAEVMGFIDLKNNFKIAT